MVQTGQPASVLTQQFEPVPQMLENVRFGAGKQPLNDAMVKQAIADAEAELGGIGRLLIRKSGTEPLIRVMAECEDEAQLKQVVSSVVQAVEAAV